MPSNVKSRRYSQEQIVRILGEIGSGRSVAETARQYGVAEATTYRRLRSNLWKNPYIESFIGKLRDECLNCEVFANLEEARAVIEAWREEYSTQRPHSSLGYLTPAEFAEQSRQGEVERGRCVGSGRATPSLRPHSTAQAVTPSLSLV